MSLSLLLKFTVQCAVLGDWNDAPKTCAWLLRFHLFVCVWGNEVLSTSSLFPVRISSCARALTILLRQREQPPIIMVLHDDMDRRKDKKKRKKRKTVSASTPHAV